MAEITQQVLEDMVRVIVDATHPEQIILFGSRSRGTPRPGSDVDLLIVETDPFEPFLESSS